MSSRRSKRTGCSLRSRRRPSESVGSSTADVVGGESTIIAELAIPELGGSVSEFDAIQLTFESALIDDGEAVLALATVGEGRDLPIGDTVFVDDFTIRAEVPNPPEPGQSIVRYQVRSADGDDNDGGYAFTLLAPRGGAVTWILLGAGIAAIAVLGFLLRLRPGSKDTAGVPGSAHDRTAHPAAGR